MTEERIARLNELARKSKTIGLTEEEKQEQATLRLAALDTVSTRWVPRAVAALKSEYPQITVSVISAKAWRLSWTTSTS